MLGKAVPGDDDTASLLVQVNRIAGAAGVTFRNLELSAAAGAPAAAAPAPAPADERRRPGRGAGLADRGRPPRRCRSARRSGPPASR